MKNLIITGFSLFLLISCAMNTDVPEAVINALNQKFPSATNIKWELENRVDYESEFKMNGMEMSATFKKDGSWLETETEIDIKLLPTAVAESIKNKYSGGRIEEVEKVESFAKGIVYELEIQHGKNESEIIVRADGMSIELENDDDDKNDETEKKMD